MIFKGCQRCGGDMRVEEDLVSRVEDLACIQCGNRQVAQVSGLQLSVGDLRSGVLPMARHRERLHLSKRPTY
jgi:hypothetical protein